MLNQKFQNNVIMKRGNGDEKLFGSIRRFQKMSRLNLQDMLQVIT